MTPPTVHLNGTSSEELLSQLHEARGAVRKAIGSLQESSPHGRDYYLQDRDAWHRASAEHLSRLGRLESVLGEIDALHEAVQSQVDERESRKST